MNYNYLKMAVCVWIALLALPNTYAQTKLLDSLKNVYQSSNNAKTKIDALNSIAFSYRNTNQDTAKTLGLLAYNLSKNNNYTIGMGTACYTLGALHYLINNDSALYYFKLGYQHYLKQPPGLQRITRIFNGITLASVQALQFDSAVHYGQLAVNYIKTSTDTGRIKPERLMYAYGSLGNTYYGISNYQKAYTYYTDAAILGEQLNNHDMLLVYYGGMANIQALLTNYDKAIYYGIKSATMASNLKDYPSLVISLANMGAYYAKIKNEPLAMLYADSSLKVGQMHNEVRSEGRNYLTYGELYMADKNYKAALDAYKKGLVSVNKANSNQFQKYVLLRETGNAYKSLDSLPQAKQMFLEALAAGKGDNDHEMACYFGLSETYLKLGDYANAHFYLQKSNILKDSIYTAEKTKAVLELNTKYETEKKEQQLLLMAKDKQLKEVELLQQRQQIANATLLNQEKERQVKTAYLLAQEQAQQMEIQQLRLHNNEILMQQQALNITNANSKLSIEKQQEQIHLSTINQQKNQLYWLLFALLAVAALGLLLFNRYKLKKRIENQANLLHERMRISHELHDEVGATLSGIAMYSHLAKTQIKQAQSAAVEKSLDIMQASSDEMVNKLNEIVWLLNPEQDSLQKLLERLEEYARNMAAIKNMQVKISLPLKIPDYPLSSETRRNIYLCCKEGINNAVKYSGASLLTLSLAEVANHIRIAITDNGQGFDPTTIKYGNGLASLQKRAIEIGATLNIDTAPGKGTNIRMDLKIT